MILRLKADNTVLYIAENIQILNNKYIVNNKNIIHDININEAEILSVDPPYGVQARTHFYDGVSWSLTPFGQDKQEEQAAIVAVAAEIVANKSNLENDVLLKQLQSMTLDQVDAYIDNSFSNISNMDEDQIDTALANLTTIAALKGAIKSLALDNVKTKQILKIVAKAAVYLIKKG